MPATRGAAPDDGACIQGAPLALTLLPRSAVTSRRHDWRSLHIGPVRSPIQSIAPAVDLTDAHEHPSRALRTPATRLGRRPYPLNQRVEMDVGV
jgi:hypothetical protein